ncbi:hypothetical protein SK128_015727 [Halocaridina rubra]|uniref:Major facilitator superfamily (MFS) profile domain-containing protein n=1 Tax=Halocaridina rubra TaxID=373956 RepID=A0AAN8XG67_HALRR
MRYLTVDDVFNVVGQFGWSQKIYYFGLNLLQIFTAFHMLLNVFTGLEPSFKCYLKNGSQKEELTNKCFNNSISYCDISYTSEFNSFVSEWNLICSEKYKVPLVQSIWMGGVMMGALMLGGVADVVGRLKTLMVSLIGTIAFEGFSSFAPTFFIMLGLRFFGGVCCALVILSSFVLSQELVGTNYRSVCGIMIAAFFAVGIGIFSVLAASVSDWRTLSFICSVCGILFMLLPCYVPESPRWLIIHGRRDEAKAVLEHIARRNGKFEELPTHWEVTVSGGDEDGKVKVNKSKKSLGVCDLIRHPYIFMLTVIQVYSWFVNSATYYGLTMAASNLGGNVYLSTALSGLIEIPACLIAVAVIDRLGRRITLCGFMLVGGIACLCIQVLPPSLVSLTTSLALCGKLSIAASFSVCYVHSAEIFPTPIRNSGMGIVSVAARIGGIISPFILMLGDVLPNLQFTALGLMTFLSGLLNLKLPETMGLPMPESIADILAMKNASSKDSSDDFQYRELQMDEEEVVLNTDDSRSRSPYSKGKPKDEDQVPLIED